MCSRNADWSKRNQVGFDVSLCLWNLVNLTPIIMNSVFILSIHFLLIEWNLHCMFGFSITLMKLRRDHVNWSIFNRLYRLLHGSISAISIPAENWYYNGQNDRNVFTQDVYIRPTPDVKIAGESRLLASSRLRQLAFRLFRMDLG